MSHYQYRRMADLHIEDQLAEEQPWFEVYLVNPDENAAMPADEELRHLTESQARRKVEELNAQIERSRGQ
jgi:hypothetical protein